MSKNKRWKDSPKKAEQAKPVAEARVEQMVAVDEKPKVDFDGWFAMRGPKIPKHHHKEILRADFSARGLGQSESLEDFDSALNQYGVKLS